MGYTVFLLFALLLALLGKSLFGLCLVLPFILAIGFQFPGRQGFVFAFIGGIVLSLVNGSLLGLDSLGLLLALGVVFLYERRFSAKHWLFFALFSLLGALVYTLVAGMEIRVLRLISDVLLTLVFLPVAMRFKERYFSEAVILKI